MIEMKLKIRDVDYAAAIDTLMPVLLEKLSASSNPFPALLLQKANGLPAAAAKAALDVLPQGIRDELAAACLNRYSTEVSQAIEHVATQKDIRLTVDSIEILAQS